MLDHDNIDIFSVPSCGFLLGRAVLVGRSCCRYLSNDMGEGAMDDSIDDDGRKSILVGQRQAFLTNL